MFHKLIFEKAVCKRDTSHNCAHNCDELTSNGIFIQFPIGKRSVLHFIIKSISFAISFFKNSQSTHLKKWLPLLKPRPMNLRSYRASLRGWNFFRRPQWAILLTRNEKLSPSISKSSSYVLARTLPRLHFRDFLFLFTLLNHQFTVYLTYFHKKLWIHLNPSQETEWCKSAQRSGHWLWEAWR